MREFLATMYASDLVDEFIDAQIDEIQTELVDEWNYRFANGQPIRYQIVDAAAAGAAVQGSSNTQSLRAARFQDVLHELTANEFEDLAAIILRFIGCYEVFSTPRSHDQGVDAFGYQVVIDDLPYGVSHRLTWIAQAKHYMEQKVSTNEVRELVGTKELLLARAFSSIDAKYSQLRLVKYAPTAIALITTEEVPATVRRLAENAGAYVFASSDLSEIVSAYLPKLTIQSLRKLIREQMKSIQALG